MTYNLIFRSSNDTFDNANANGSSILVNDGGGLLVMAERRDSNGVLGEHEEEAIQYESDRTGTAAIDKGIGVPWDSSLSCSE